jgi:hypothetical protein
MTASHGSPCGRRRSILTHCYAAEREPSLPVSIARPAAIQSALPSSRDKQLVRVLGPIKDLITELWIVTHRSLKDTARVRSFMETVGNGVKRHIAAVPK